MNSIFVPVLVTVESSKIRHLGDFVSIEVEDAESFRCRLANKYNKLRQLLDASFFSRKNVSFCASTKSVSRLLNNELTDLIFKKGNKNKMLSISETLNPFDFIILFRPHNRFKSKMRNSSVNFELMEKLFVAEIDLISSIFLVSLIDSILVSLWNYFFKSK
jgi:hypothetical protein